MKKVFSIDKKKVNHYKYVFFFFLSIYQKQIENLKNEDESKLFNLIFNFQVQINFYYYYYFFLNLIVPTLK